MSPDALEPEDEVFARLLAAPRDEHDRLLADACRGRPEVRERLELLLRAHAAAGGFMEASPASRALPEIIRLSPGPDELPGRRIGRPQIVPKIGEEAAVSSDLSAILSAVGLAKAEAEIGDRIGRYKLLQKIGEGGCGSVYLAEQTEPVRRQVALKIIKRGMDTRDVIARFEAERQALALMDHPNIARVFDAGATDNGGPFFVMELVPGTPITRFCDEERLSTRARLELFIEICHAVQHAHQKGIIHRDLKPSNILVARHEGRVVPKVIDFGIAKATQGRLTDATMLTALQQLIGTPVYMSPEQAEMGGVDIDTRSDIYSLGVLLYELLAGHPPFDPRTLLSAGLDEIRRVIREVEPPRPCTRLSTLTDADRSTIAQRRGATPAQLASLLRGDLEWIVMRCLEKDRTRRYETANGLARDLARHLQDEPVVARPPSVTYRLQKLVRRHQLAVAAGAAVFVALTAGLAASLWQAALARDQARRANVETVRASEAERIARTEAAVAKAVNDFLNEDLLSQAGGWRQGDQGLTPNPKLTVREALDRAAKRIGTRFKDSPQVEAPIRQTIGRAYAELGEHRVAEEHHARAVELRRTLLGPNHVSTLRSVIDLLSAYINRGRLAEATALGEEVSRSSNAVLGPNHPETLRAMFHLSLAYRDSGRWHDMRRILEDMTPRVQAVRGMDDFETLRTMSRLAEAYGRTDRQPDGVALIDWVVERTQRVLGPDHPMTLVALGHKAMIYVGAGRVSDALAPAEEALQRTLAVLGPDHPDAANSMFKLAQVYRGLGRVEEALAMFDRSFRSTRKILGEEHPFTIGRMHTLADQYRSAGRVADALPLYAEAVELTKRLNRDVSAIASHLDCMAIAHRMKKQFAEAESVHREAVAMLEQKYGVGAIETGYTVSGFVVTLIEQRKFTEAEALLRQDLAAREAKTPDHWRMFALRTLLGDVLTRSGRFEEAESLLISSYEGVMAREKQISPTGRASLRATLHQSLIRFYDATSRPEEAAKYRRMLTAQTRSRAPSPPPQ